MAAALAGIKKLGDNYGAQLAAVLLIYACYHSLAEHIFFDGFLHTFAWLNKLVFGAGAAPAFMSSLPYHSSSILLYSLLNPYFLSALALFYLPLLVKRKELANKTVTFDKASRIVIFTAAIVLAWELSTYDYNYYLGQAFYFDRIALVLLAVLLLRYPLLSPLFIAFAFVYRSQFNYPVEGFPLFDKRLLFDVLVMFVAHTYVRLFIPSFKTHFLYLVLCIMGASYFMTGFKKLAMRPRIYGWVTQNSPGDLFANVHYRGWYVNMSDATAQSVALWLHKYRIPLQTIVLLIELSGLLLLRSRRLAILCLICFPLMHLGIFALGSMLFWKWMCLDLVLAGILVWRAKELPDDLFGKKAFRASLIIMALSVIWLKPMKVGWYDTPLTQYFTYEVVSPQGKVYELDKNQMNPYHQWFEYDNFFFLLNAPCLRVGVLGYTGSYELARAVKQCGPEGTETLEARLGKNVYDPTKKALYQSFIKTYFRNRNQMAGKLFIPGYLHAPNHLYSYAKAGAYEGQVRVQEFRVIYNQVYTYGGKKNVLRKIVIDDIFIPN